MTTQTLPRRVYIHVWDPIIRAGHWLLVLCFGAVYFYADKFPLHVYAAYIIMAYMVFRIFWGFVGPRPARFSSFIYGPRTLMKYGADSVVGHPMHTISHNPLGGLMVVGLILSMLVSGVLGIMLYSSGQEMGILGDRVPSDWETNLMTAALFGQEFTFGLKELHIWSGNIAASLVVAHFLGNLWSTAVHRYRPVVGMITGVKDADEDDPELHYYKRVAEPKFAKNLYDATGPVTSETILVAGILICIAWPLTEFLVWVNRFIPSY